MYPAWGRCEATIRLCRILVPDLEGEIGEGGRVGGGWEEGGERGGSIGNDIHRCNNCIAAISCLI